jgi:hypothetical protein
MTSGLRFSLVACLVLAGAAAICCAADETNKPVRMGIDLVDGSHVVGTPNITAIYFQTPYAKMNLPLGTVRTMTHGTNSATFTLALANGDRLEGNLSLEKLQLDTLFGPLAVDLKFIKTVRILHGEFFMEGLVLYFAFDEAGGAAKDATGRNNGVVVDAEWTPDGRIGGAYRVGKNVGYIQVPASDSWSFGMKPFSICMWFKFDTVPHGESVFIGCDEGGGERNKWLFEVLNGAVDFHINNQNSESYRTASYRWQPETGKWYHLAVTRRASLHSIYIDGLLVSTDNNPLPIPTAKAPLTIGQAEELYVEGVIDEVMIFDRALSADEVQQIHDAAK